MKRLLVIVSCVAVIVSAIRSEAAPASVVVYDDITGPETSFYGKFTPGTIQVGDEVLLSGATPAEEVSVRLAQFSFLYSATGINPALATVSLTLYANDGLLASGSPSPSTVLWASSPFPLVNSGGTGYETLIYDQTDFGSLLVPRHLTWAIQFAGIGSGTVGLPILSPPSPGLNWDSYWQKIGTGPWSQNVVDNTPMSFGAIITAQVPDSSTFWDLPLGALAIVLVGGGVRRRQALVSARCAS